MDKTPLEELKSQAIDYYKKAATGFSHFNSLIPKAINSYNPWRSVDNPPVENKIVMVHNPTSTFETGEERLMYYREQEGFPDNITHWKDKPKPPS